MRNVFVAVWLYLYQSGVVIPNTTACTTSESFFTRIREDNNEIRSSHAFIHQNGIRAPLAQEVYPAFAGTQGSQRIGLGNESQASAL